MGFLRPILRHLPANLLGGFQGWFVALHALAVLTTYLLIVSGIDLAVRDWFVANEPLGARDVAWIHFYIGEVYHVLIGLWIFRTGFWSDDREWVAGGSAILQALLAVSLVIVFLKVATGRPPPLRTEDAAEFQPFMVQNLYVMWPSGHTGAAFGAAASAHAYYRAKTWVPWLGYSLAALVGLTMINGHFHWLSDVVAAVFIATPIGWSVGTAYRAWANEVKPRPDAAAPTSAPTSEPTPKPTSEPTAEVADAPPSEPPPTEPEPSE